MREKKCDTCGKPWDVPFTLCDDCAFNINPDGSEPYHVFTDSAEYATWAQSELIRIRQELQAVEARLMEAESIIVKADKAMNGQAHSDNDQRIILGLIIGDCAHYLAKYKTNEGENNERTD